MNDVVLRILRRLSDAIQSQSMRSHTPWGEPVLAAIVTWLTLQNHSARDQWQLTPSGGANTAETNAHRARVVPD